MMTATTPPTNTTTPPAAPAVAKKYLNTREAAAYLGKSVHTLYKWRSLQTGPEYFKRNGVAYYSIEGLDAWVTGEK